MFADRVAIAVDLKCLDQRSICITKRILRKEAESPHVCFFLVKDVSSDAYAFVQSEKVNPNGGAIAFGHPLGALSLALLHI